MQGGGRPDYCLPRATYSGGAGDKHVFNEGVYVMASAVGGCLGFSFCKYEAPPIGGLEERELE